MIDVLVDDREPDEFIRFLKFFRNDPQFRNKFNIKKERLEHGDVICQEKLLNGNTAIEIKRVKNGDWINSVFDKRFPNQFIEMNSEFDNIIYLFIGDVNNVFRKRKINPTSYWGSVASLVVRYKGNIISVPTEEMGALLCFYIFKHSDLKANMKIKHKLKINKQDRQISAIRCIKGIGKSLAIELLKRYSISKISSIKDYKKFMEIDGIGEKKAKDIVLFFHNSLD